MNNVWWGGGFGVQNDRGTKPIQQGNRIFPPISMFITPQCHTLRMNPFVDDPACMSDPLLYWASCTLPRNWWSLQSFLCTLLPSRRQQFQCSEVVGLPVAKYFATKGRSSCAVCKVQPLGLWRSNSRSFVSSSAGAVSVSSGPCIRGECTCSSI